MSRFWITRLLGSALVLTMFGTGVGQQNPSITILINNSPWLGGFEALVEEYEEVTGNPVELNVTPFDGMLQRSRDAVSANESEFDIINLNEQWYSLFYSQELVAPILEIDPEFELDPEIIEYDYATRWDHTVNFSTGNGDVYGLPINGNIQLLFYRQDLLEEAGIEPPQTWEELEEAAAALHDPPQVFGLVNRTSPGDWEVQSYFYGYGGGIIDLDEDTGQWDVIVNEEASVRALEQWVRFSRTYGPPSYANVSQAEMFGLMASGRAAMAHMVGASAPDIDDPEQSSVVGRVGTTVVPGPTPDERATTSGIWVMGIPSNLPSERQSAALDFLEWALSKDAQMFYSRAGAIPVRQDVYEELGQEEGFEWMQAFAESTPYIRAQPRIVEAPQVIEVFRRWVGEAVLGMSAQEALDNAAEEIQQIMESGGYDVEPLQ